jgi:non-haem Fe2+, alpha-ketoglutarate-dependent halogenase
VESLESKIEIPGGSVTDSATIAENLRRYGYSAGIGRILSPQEIIELESLMDKFIADKNIPKDYSANAPSASAILGKAAKVDKYIEKILTYPAVQGTLKAMLGPHYKIWEISARYSLPGDIGLSLHQDAWGQMNLAFALNAQTTTDGVTGVLPESHLLPRWAAKISWTYPRLWRFFVTPFLLRDTDFGFFINRAWHMRFPNRGTTTKKIILIGFYPVGGKYKYLYSGQKLKISSQCSELKKRLDPKQGTRQAKDGFLIVKATKGEPTPFTAELENKNSLRIWPLIPLLKILVVEIIFRPLRLMQRLIHRIHA